MEDDSPVVDLSVRYCVDVKIVHFVSTDVFFFSRKEAHREQPFKFDLADLPQDLSVHRSHFSAPTPAQGAGFSGNGVSRTALSPLPVQAHLQSPFAALHHRSGGAAGKNPWPKDEIQVFGLMSMCYVRVNHNVFYR